MQRMTFVKKPASFEFCLAKDAICDLQRIQPLRGFKFWQTKSDGSYFIGDW